MSLPDGIYLNLDFETYVQDDAFGSHDLSAILLNAVQFHAENRNAEWRALLESHMTERERTNAARESFATLFGTALHTILLEPETFDARYFEEPDKPDWPDTKGQMAAALTHAGHLAPKDSQLKDVFINACHAAGLKVADDWDTEREKLAAGRICLSPRTIATLRLLEATFRQHCSAPKWLSNGLAEVSVFWTDQATGLRLKCRFDYLRIRHCSDVKTYRLRPGAGAVESFIFNANAFAWDFQAGHYMDCRLNVMPDLIGEGQIWQCDDGGNARYAQGETLTFMRQLAAYETPAWAWIACATGGYPEVDVIRYPTETMSFQSATVQVMEARRIAAECFAKFGDGAWVSDRPTVVLNDAILNSGRALNRGAVLYDIED